MIVDSHVHVVSDDPQTYPVRPNPPPWPLTTGDMLSGFMKEASVDYSLLVQTFFTYGYDNSYAANVSKANPERFGCVCVLDPVDESTPDKLDDLVTNHGVVGIRLMNDRQHNEITLDDKRTWRLWATCERLGIPVCAAALIDDVARVSVPLEKFPNVVVAIDHIWGLKVGDGPDFPAIRPVLELARYPNLRVKIAPNNSFSVRAGTGTVDQFYGLLVDTFGPERLIWGSNFPAHPKVYGTYADRMKLGRDDLAFLGDGIRRKIMGENALAMWPMLRKRAQSKS